MTCRDDWKGWLEEMDVRDGWKRWKRWLEERWFEDDWKRRLEEMVEEIEENKKRCNGVLEIKRL